MSSPLGVTAFQMRCFEKSAASILSSSCPKSKSDEALKLHPPFVLDREEFLSSVSQATTIATLLVPQAVHANNNDNLRYSEEILPMIYAQDKKGSPKSIDMKVRRITGGDDEDSTTSPYLFSQTPYSFQKTWPPKPPNEQTTTNNQNNFPFSPTDFFRSDSNDDGWFYKVPKLVYHVDEAAILALTHYYRNNIPAKSDILDLCSSWVSHYPTEFSKTMGKICGTGMNERELVLNPQLMGYEVKDLNEDPNLLYPDESFDVVTCALSIEYLIQPIEVLQEVQRILRPHGKMIVAISNRCFPSKTIAVWLKTTNEEHLELANGYFQYAGGFEEPRKAFDITAKTTTLSSNNKQESRGDPIFVIEATKTATKI